MESNECHCSNLTNSCQNGRTHCFKSRNDSFCCYCGACVRNTPGFTSLANRSLRHPAPHPLSHRAHRQAPSQPRCIASREAVAPPKPSTSPSMQTSTSALSSPHPPAGPPRSNLNPQTPTVWMKITTLHPTPPSQPIQHTALPAALIETSRYASSPRYIPPPALHTHVQASL